VAAAGKNEEREGVSFPREKEEEEEEER